jgi:hypothetical protein
MRKKRPCSVCDEMTSRLLFKDKILSIPICSAECEHGYLESLSPKDEDRVLKRLDERIETAKLHDRMCWATACLGVIVLAVGFFAKNVSVFLAAVLPIAVGAFLTRHFEQKTRKLARLRKRIRI